MIYVIDSSVGLKWAVSEVDSDKSLHLLTEYSSAIHTLLAPDLFPIEIANALASAEKSSRIQPGEAVRFLTDILNNAPVIHEAIPLLRRALEISLPTRQSVYDCLYIALAEREGCEFITADDKLARTLQLQFPFIKSLASFP